MRRESRPRSAPDKPAIVIAGDVVVDHHIYQGERPSPTMENQRGVREVREHGGACAIARLLTEPIRIAERERKRAKEQFEKDLAEGKKINPPVRPPIPEESWTIELGVTTPLVDEDSAAHHAYALWRPYPRTENAKESVWRASLLMGYGHDDDADSTAPIPSRSRYRLEPKPGCAVPRILVLDDGGFLFRHRAQERCWQLPKKGQPVPDWIVLKMSAPVAQGDLWHALSSRFSDRLICVVSTKDLRRECVGLSEGLSWERTVEELRDGLRDNPALSGLLACRHLIVCFSSDGALWLDRTDSARPAAVLVCEAGGVEGEWARGIPGESFGFLSCMVAAITRGLLHATDLDGKSAAGEPFLVNGVAAGLAAMRDLREFGHGLTGERLPVGYPADRLAGVIANPRSALSRIPIPWPNSGASPKNERRWMVVEMSQRPLHSSARPSLLGLARQVVFKGTSVLESLPHAEFGGLFTADRFEIESLRGIRRLMLDHRERKGARKPLSLGVFGPPGAGKSFGVRQIANSIFGKEAWLEFNLSQFSGTADLIGAFHQVRDQVLGGLIPVVFWDEFDSQEYYWLQYLLAPMQDGRFQEGQLNHSIGKCVFVFAGGTSPTFEEFGPPPSDEGSYHRYRLRKGPDFLGRLDCYYDVLGPNQRTRPRAGGRRSEPRQPDPDDVCYPLRRALLIRSLLKCPPEARLDIDPDLVDTLLQVREYRHGARSLEKLVAGLGSAADGPIRRSAMPPPDQLAMHVDAESFTEILDRNASFRQEDVVDALAPAIHETWRKLSKREGWSMQPHLDQPYEKLAPADKEDNRAAAKRIPDVLALAGLTLAKGARRGARDAARSVTKHLEHHLERLAEAEHDGWMDHRLQNGWRHHEKRDDRLKHHPALLPYAKLSEADKEKDRNSVRHFPNFVELAGYRIAFPEV